MKNDRLTVTGTYWYIEINMTNPPNVQSNFKKKNIGNDINLDNGLPSIRLSKYVTHT